MKKELLVPSRRSVLKGMGAGIVASAFSNQVARKKAAFEAQLREVFKDGQMSEDEQAALKRLQVQYRFTDLQVEAMLQRAKSKTAGGRS